MLDVGQRRQAAVVAAYVAAGALVGALLLLLAAQLSAGDHSLWTRLSGG